MTLYWVRQDDTIWGCGEPGCCGEYEENITESFVDCECQQVEPDVKPNMKGHLQACNGGGPVLKWRKAKTNELIAYYSGVSNGHAEGWSDALEWQRRENE